MAKMQTLEIEKLSNKYQVRKLGPDEIPEVFELCKKNTLYYQYCPPMITLENVREEMQVLPPGTKADDKYFLGYYDGNMLIAIMDLIDGYPNESTLYIGLFMTEVSVQGKNVGSGIIQELIRYGKTSGYSRLELAWVKGNPQSEHFWKKNGFFEIGERKSNAAEHVIAAEKVL